MDFTPESAFDVLRNRRSNPEERISAAESLLQAPYIDPHLLEKILGLTARERSERILNTLQRLRNKPQVRFLKPIRFMGQDFQVQEAYTPSNPLIEGSLRAQASAITYSIIHNPSNQILFTATGVIRRNSLYVSGIVIVPQRDASVLISALQNPHARTADFFRSRLLTLLKQYARLHGKRRLTFDALAKDVPFLFAHGAKTLRLMEEFCRTHRGAELPFLSGLRPMHYRIRKPRKRVSSPAKRKINLVGRSRKR